MEQSRGKYEEAKIIFEEVSTQAFQIGLDSAEGAHAIFKATQHFNIALKQYSDALHRFTTFLLDRSLHPNRK